MDGARDVLRVSIDGFHRPRSQRYAPGPTAETFYETPTTTTRSGAPGRAVPGGRARGRARSTTSSRGAGRPGARAAVGPGAVLLVDGIFLQRPELADVWDASVWVDVPFEVSVPRGNARFGDGHDPDPAAEANARYVEGQRLYLAAADPRARATWVLDNTDLDRPVLRPAPCTHRRAVRRTANCSFDQGGGSSQGGL